MLTETFADDFAGVGNHNKCMGDPFAGHKREGLLPDAAG